MTLTAGFRDSLHPGSITTVGEHAASLRAFHTPAIPASAAWPAANRAYFVPFRVTVPTTIAEMSFYAGTSPGTANYDLGIYRDDFTRLWSLGATASVNSTDAILPSGGASVGLTLRPGRYYMAMSSAATTITVRSAVNANQIMRALGLQMMESAHPLPATVTPVSVGTSAFMPVIILATITNVI